MPYFREQGMAKGARPLLPLGESVIARAKDACKSPGTGWQRACRSSPCRFFLPKQLAGKPKRYAARPVFSATMKPRTYCAGAMPAKVFEDRSCNCHGGIDK